MISGDHIVFATLSTPAVGHSAGLDVWSLAAGGVNLLSSAATSGNADDLTFTQWTQIDAASSLVDGTTYYLAVTACDITPVCSTSDRVAFTYHATATVGVASFTASEAKSYNHSIQLFGSLGAGTATGSVEVAFITAGGWTPASVYSRDGAPARGTPYAVSSLTNGTSYYVSMITRNASGFSSWSSRTGAMGPFDAPPPPTGGSAAPGALSAALTWSAPAADGGTWSVTGYEVQYSTDDGLTWHTATSDTGSAATSYTASGLSATAQHVFRMAARSASGLGGYSGMTTPVVPTRNTQTVTWTPSNTAVTGTAGSITPSAAAATSGNGAITYSVTSPGATDCTVNATTGVVNYTAPGSCQVTASAAQTATYSQGAIAVTFTITAPSSGGGGGGGGGGASSSPITDSTPAPAPSTTPPTSSPDPTSPPATPQTSAVQAGVPDNPPARQVLTRGLILVGEQTALATPVREMRNAPATLIAPAPTVQSTTGKPISLAAPGLTPGITYAVKIKVNGRYVDLGSAIANPTGVAQLPVFAPTRPGSYTVAIVNPVTGQTNYIKIRVQARR